MELWNTQHACRVMGREAGLFPLPGDDVRATCTRMTTVSTQPAPARSAAAPQEDSGEGPAETEENTDEVDEDDDDEEEEVDEKQRIVKKKDFMQNT